MEAPVMLRFMRGDATVAEQALNIPAGSRATFDAAAIIAIGDTPASDFSTLFQGTNGTRMVCERPMYFDALGASGGHCVMGYVR